VNTSELRNIASKILEGTIIDAPSFDKPAEFLSIVDTKRETLISECDERVECWKSVDWKDHGRLIAAVTPVDCEEGVYHVYAAVTGESSGQEENPLEVETIVFHTLLDGLWEKLTKDFQKTAKWFADEEE